MERGGRPSLEITSPHLNLSIILRPSAAEEYDLWLAALLCWQQLRPSGTKNTITRSGSSVALPPLRSEMQRRASSSGLREATVIKVGRVMLWDKGLATSPRAIVKRPSARDLRIPHMAWKHVSCILSDNGELKLMTEHDVSLLAMIELSQLSRVTEAKLRNRTFPQEGNLMERQGKDMAELDPIVGNYFAEVILDGEVRGRTSTKSNTKNPFWREDCEFTDLPPSLPYLSVVLKRIVGNTESFSHQLQATLGLPKAGQLSEVLCGAVDIPLHLLERGKDHEQWLQVYDARQQSIGTMLLKVHHEEVVVLHSKEYQPLSELLHRFGSGLTTQIAEVMPGNLRKLAEIFVNIFQVSGKATEWLVTLVEEEIDAIGNQTASKQPRFNQRLMSNDSIASTDKIWQTVEHMRWTLPGEASLLFRGNSLLTQAFEFYMRRLGKEYLEETLAEKIREINELDLDCEVDPSRVQNGDDIQQHWAKLIELTSVVWRCIASSAHRLPSEIRHVLKYIRAVAEDRYGHFHLTATTVYTSVSGFLFLRFLCPAILNPKLFGLLRDHPKPRAQRTLTLIAKSIQALANLNIASKKETWMEPMTEFLQKQRQPFKDFADAVCAIPAESTSTSVPAPYSTPLTILGRLSPLAREGFPSLPYLVDHARNFAALAKLWAKIHSESDWDSSNCEGDLLHFHRLCTALHQRAAHCFSQMETRRSAGETTSKPPDERLRLSDALDNLSYDDVLDKNGFTRVRHRR
ncbi:GTPase activating factor [Neurospora sp. IMI 360204]|nr:GTPase activating factor [Neurospora sp. IMI 360204]